ncbi:large-conductance mechanosensitive channel [Algimonas ampicilliniresistens]|jgi:large conductance mechanosensitive channel|uniref:Large-conductance mechanosensitive channel n=1 Tax=Algimonas ampicilliniresistens TaxID=1298735 RepID=A0ABQ5VD14_9PROT|nr:large conductance mechanosensitive channel protein MscL [Algimonas ampicilliniresistens]GLQ24972.1 large-conductance mechanosensitive channel [Algimonas ampicilliniresistens]
MSVRQDGDNQMGMISEFKDFAMKGNLIDMAVGFVMGSAFATVVKDFIDGVFMPAIQPIMGGIDLSEWKMVLREPVTGADGTVVDAGWIINWGQFLTSLISFIIVAFVMFLIIKSMNKAKKKEEAAPSAPPANEVLLAEIRDLLARQNAKL